MPLMRWRKRSGPVPSGSPTAVDPLFVAYPELSQEIDRLCELPPWQMTGTSALVVSPEGMVLELTKPKHWERRADGVTVVGVGAIGGSLEAGETLLDCLQREAREELGTPLQIVSARETAIVYERDRVVRTGASDRPSAGHPLPALMTVSENLYRPELGPDARTLAIATFWARIDHEPRLGDLFGMLVLPMGQAESVLMDLPLAIEEVQAVPGARLITRAPLPMRAVLEPVWTAHSARRVLQEGSLPGMAAE